MSTTTSLDIDPEEKLGYESEEMEDYNRWLDESVDFPIQKARYSRVLFEYDSVEYENRYVNEYPGYSEAKGEDVPTEFPIESGAEPKVGVREKDTPYEAPNSGTASSKEKSEAWFKHWFGPKDEKPKEVVVLANEFDEEIFWTDSRNSQLQAFALEGNLKTDELREIINEYLFTSKPPLRDGVAKVMREKPPLRAWARITSELTKKIVDFSDSLKASENEIETE